MRTRCIECDVTMEDDEWELHKMSYVHLLNIKVNMVSRTMRDVGIDIEDLEKVLKDRAYHGSKAGEITDVLDVHQKGAMRA